MATINDVATRAGVSTATVSRALNGKSTVDPNLVSRVLDAAAELGYQPNGPARNLRRQETAVLALIISDVENPFFTSIARGVEDVAHAVGYSVVLCNSDEDPDKERKYIDVAIQERVAGVVLSTTGVATNVDLLTARGTPLVAVDRPLPDTEADM
ncbi:LacI family DNA-binding transcriptional regulator, partial [Kibdelosporangium lantanae]